MSKTAGFEPALYASSKQPLWCARQATIPHATRAIDPKSIASANSATCAKEWNALLTGTFREEDFLPTYWTTTSDSN